MALFGKAKYTIVKVAKKRSVPDGLWTRCEECSEIIYSKVLEENLKVCPKCDYHLVLSSHERIAMFLDNGSFQEEFTNLKPVDPINFSGPKAYKDRIVEDQKTTGLNDAVVVGRGSIGGKATIFGVTDSRFMMGSMGSVVGEKITRAIELATELSLPLIIFSGSGGGARMQEGMLSLMQMAKTSAALTMHNDKGLLFISILTHPTMAGVMASFASLGDIIIAEPKALVGFTGPRVIEQTIRQKLPKGFQRSEFLLEHGMIDMVVHRKKMKPTLIQLLDCLV